MKRWVFFDLDGTLTDSAEGILKSVRYALERLGFPDAPDSVLRRFIGPPLHDSFMVHCGFSREEAQRAVEVYRERYSAVGVRENTLYPGMEAVLQALRAAGASIGLATSKPAVFAEKILRQHGILPLFSEIIGANLDGSMTDKAEILAEAKRRAGSAQILMVGDREFDVFGARACGIDCVGVAFGFAEPGELQAAGAVEIAETAEELLEILLRRLK